MADKLGQLQGEKHFKAYGVSTFRGKGQIAKDKD
jgi:hypothetical protein